MIKKFNKGDTTQISANFKAKEMNCKCNQCNSTLIDLDLIKGLQRVRDHFNKPLNITSGYRCPSHNAAVGGARASYHMKGQAADVYINGVTPLEIAQYAESTGLFNGIGRYSSFVHLDTRSNKYFWENLGNGEKAVQTHGTNTLKPDEIKTNIGIGRLKVKDINVELYDNNKQETCDREDSACYYKQGEGYIIADHNTQAFKTLKNVGVGDVATIIFSTGTSKQYKCVKAINGHNTGNNITDENGVSLYNSNALLMYTCRDKWQNITIRLFDEISETNTNNENLDAIINFEQLAEIVAEEVKKTIKKTLAEHLGDCFAG